VALQAVTSIVGQVLPHKVRGQIAMAACADGLIDGHSLGRAARESRSMAGGAGDQLSLLILDMAF
jgi:hypothetical protein